MKESKCEICEYVFKTKIKLKKHYNQNHNKNEKFLNCNICTKSFQKQNTLTSHVKSVHGGKKYICKYCSKAFSQLGRLKHHLLEIGG